VRKHVLAALQSLIYSSVALDAQLAAHVVSILAGSVGIARMDKACVSCKLIDTDWFGWNRVAVMGYLVEDLNSTLSFLNDRARLVLASLLAGM
jgi:hypothetical protein